jgi:hypothetical protein
VPLRYPGADIRSGLQEGNGDGSRSERPGSVGANQAHQGGASLLGISTGEGVVGALGKGLSQPEAGSESDERERAHGGAGGA